MDGMRARESRVNVAVPLHGERSSNKQVGRERGSIGRCQLDLDGTSLDASQSALDGAKRNPTRNGLAAIIHGRIHCPQSTVRRLPSRISTRRMEVLGASPATCEPQEDFFVSGAADFETWSSQRMLDH